MMRKMTHKKIALGALGFLLLGGLLCHVPLAELFGIQTVLAAGPATPAVDSTIGFLSTLMGYIITGLNTLTWILFMFLDILIRPETVFGPQKEFLPMIQKLWVLSRNTVNVAMVFVLLFGAITTIVTADLEKIRTQVPKFVVTLILVNFSWFIPRVLYDVSTVLSTMVFNIPSQVGNGQCKMGTEDCIVVSKVLFFEDTADAANLCNASSDFATPKPILPGIVTICTLPYSADEHTLRPLVNALMVNYGNMRNLAQVPRGKVGAKDMGAIVRFLIRMSIVFVMHVAIAFPLLALVIAFAVRIPMLWLTMAFMPFVALTFVVPQISSMGFDPKKTILENFLFAAFLPALIGLPFAIGFIIMNSGVEFQNLPDTEALTGFKDTNQLIWMIMAMGIIWMGVFMILKKNTIMAGFSGSIESAGKGLGKFAAQVPLSVPILPAPGGKPGDPKMSILGGVGKFKAAQSAAAQGKLFDQHAQTKATAIESIKNNTNNLSTDMNNTFNFNNALTGKAFVDDVGQKFKTLFKNKMGKEFVGTDQEAAEAMSESDKIQDAAAAQKLRQALIDARRAAAGGAANP